MKPKGKDENRLGPVNPFALGTAFVEAAKQLEWVEEEKTERHRQYFITSKGFEEMARLGMDIQKALTYRQPPSEGARRGPSHAHHQSRDRRRH